VATGPLACFQVFVLSFKYRLFNELSLLIVASIIAIFLFYFKAKLLAVFFFIFTNMPAIS